MKALMKEAPYTAEICVYSTIKKKRPLPVFQINICRERNARARDEGIV
jgi:hypothetical protein